MAENDGYNDAWNTPGWTAQNMAYPPEDAPTDLPVLPYITVTGTFRDAEGRHFDGVVTAIPSQNIAVSGGTQFYLETKRERIRGGQVSFQIPIGEWTWTIRQRIGPRTFVDVGLQPVTDLDLSTLSHAADPNLPLEVIIDGGGA